MGFGGAEGFHYSGPPGLIALFSSTANKTVTGIAEESLIGTGPGSATTPANTLAVGDVLTMEARGYYTRTAGTITFRSKLAGNVQTSSAAAPAAATNGAFSITIMITIRAVGVGGTAISQGYYQTFDNAGAQNSLQRAFTPQIATFAINTTIANTYDLTSQFSVVGAVNSITCTNFSLSKTKL